MVANMTIMIHIIDILFQVWSLNNLVELVETKSAMMCGTIK